MLGRHHDGEVALQWCRFTGGVQDSGSYRGGCGLLLSNRVHGLVQRCEVVDNAAHGIKILAESQLALEHNTCQQNGAAGIQFIGVSSCTAQGNMCNTNGWSGILVGAEAQPELIQNSCQNGERRFRPI